MTEEEQASGTQSEHAQWQGTTSGTTTMHRWLIAVLRCIGVLPLYALILVIMAPGYMLFHRQAYHAIFCYLRRRHGYSRWRAFWGTWKNHFLFGQVVIDRFAAFAGSKFKFRFEGMERLEQMMEGDDGFVIFSCHVGNYELAGYTFTSPTKRYNALVFPGEAAIIMQQRQKLLSQHNIRIIAADEAMGHVFTMNSALADGEIVSIPADRNFGSPRRLTCRLLGKEAQLPLGPFTLCTSRGTAAVATFVMKECFKTYRVIIRPLTIPADTPRSERQQRLAQAFADELTAVLRRYPEQWYNYYDFWNEDNKPNTTDATSQPA